MSNVNTRNTVPDSDDRTFGERFKDAIKHPMLPYYGILGSVTILLIGGILMVFSASSVYSMQVNNGNSYSLAIKQLAFAGFGTLCMWRISKMNVGLFRKYAGFGLVVSFALLVLVLFIGQSVYGQKNWIPLPGGFNLQPSEIAKVALVVWSADLLARRYRELYMVRRLAIPLIPVSLAFLILVMLEGDTGTAIVMAPIVLAMLFFVGVPLKWFAIPTVMGAVVLAYVTLGSGYRTQRFTSWLDPGASSDGAGFQVIHGRQAIGTGGWLGVGIGGSRQKWGTLPAAHTDFIYAVIGEEIGLFGTSILLILFGAIAFSAFRIAHNTRDPFIQLATVGVMAWILTQMLINVGAVLSILPITGVPIPLVSYGGSSLVPTLCAFGMLMAFAKHEATVMGHK